MSKKEELQKELEAAKINMGDWYYGVYSNNFFLRKERLDLSYVNNRKIKSYQAGEEPVLFRSVSEIQAEIDALPPEYKKGQ